MTVPKILIDGYNLLFQSQLVGKGRGRDWLSAARRRLVQLLHQRLTPDELKVTQIVFDAPSKGPAPEPDAYPSGLAVVYAVDHAEADDLLEHTIRLHPTPKLLTVVSSDLRIRRCARSRRANSLGADQFLQKLEQWPLSSAINQLPISATGTTDEQLLSEPEIAFWLKEFDTLDDYGQGST